MPTPSQTARRGETWLFLAVYTCSGLAGLIYQVSWTRLLTLYMGHSTASTSAVVGAFMGGLAAGTAFGGRIASCLTKRQALAAYAILELVVVVTALALPLEIRALNPLLRWAYGNESPGALFAVVRVTSALAVLFIPATALGATFPMAIAWFAGEHDRPGRTARALYAANTVGAAAGALAAGLLLIPRLGVYDTTLVAITASVLAIGGTLVLLKRKAVESDATQADSRTTFGLPSARTHKRGVVRTVRGAEQTSPAQTNADPETPLWLPAALLGISGFAALMLEVVWTRLFSLLIGPTTYAFSVTVASVIAGLALGAVVGAWIAGRIRRPALWLAAALCMTALATTITGWTAGRYGGLALRLLPGVVDPELVRAGRAFGQVLARQVTLVAVLVLPTALGLGTLFPLALEMLKRRSAHIAREAGIVYATNSVAGLAGALVAGFVTIPLFGLQGSFRMAVGLFVAAAGLALIAGGLTGRARRFGVLAGGAALAAVSAAPSWDRALLASGAYKYAPYVARTLDLEPALKAGRMLYYREGAVATVSVTELAGTRSLAIDGKVDASNAGDMLTQKTLAHLPLLLHGEAREICIIGLGSGVTLASALQHPIGRADVVELSPEVVEASEYFSDVDARPLDDPRTHLVVGDGRAHLLHSSRTYDVIISEPSNPWIAGVASLFTREFFLAARDRLAPGGIICQWAHTYDIAERDLQSIVATFRSVFPDGTLWLIGQSDILLVGSTGPLDRHFANVVRGWQQQPAVAADLRHVSASGPFSFLSLYVAGPAALARYASDVPVQTDDRMALEFSAPSAINNPAVSTKNVEDLLRLRDVANSPPVIRDAWRTAGVREWRDRAAMMQAANAYDTAYEDYSRALRLVPGDAETLAGLTTTAIALKKEQQAIELLKATPDDAALAPTWIAVSKLLAAGGSVEPAIEAAREACNRTPDAVAAWEQLALLLTERGDAASLDPVVSRMQELFPDSASTSYYAAAANVLHNRFEEALVLATRAIEKDPHMASAHALQGLIQERLHRPDPARDAFKEAIRLQPRGSKPYVDLGLLELRSGQPAVAKQYFVEALLLDPASLPAQQGLAQADAQLR